MVDIDKASEFDLEDDDFEEEQRPEPKPWERSIHVQPGGSAAGLDLSGMELGGDLSVGFVVHVFPMRGIDGLDVSSCRP